MNSEHFQSRRVVTAAGTILAVLLVLGGCSSTNGSGAASLTAVSSSAATASASPPGKRPVAAKPKSNHPDTFTAVVNEVRGSGDGFLTVVWTVTNTSDGTIVLSDHFALDGTAYSYYAQAIAGVTVVDLQTKLRYYPLQGDGTTCVCSEYVTHEADDELAPGDTWTMFDTYRPDRIPAKVEVDIKGFAPAKDVPVTRL